VSQSPNKKVLNDENILKIGREIQMKNVLSGKKRRERQNERMRTEC
jgi:hypothetical protein